MTSKRKKEQGRGRTAALTADQQRLITTDLMNYAEAEAMKYAGCCNGALQPCDLKQEALYGLCRAAQQYEAQNATASLKTYATYYIKKYVLLAIEEHGLPMRLNSDERAFVRFFSIEERQEKMDESGEGDSWLEEALGAEAEDEQTAEVQEREERELARMLEQLTPKERQVLELVHGPGTAPHSIREAAREMGVTPERARGIYNKAIARLQVELYPRP